MTCGPVLTNSSVMSLTRLVPLGIRPDIEALVDRISQVSVTGQQRPESLQWPRECYW